MTAARVQNALQLDPLSVRNSPSTSGELIDFIATQIRLKQLHRNLHLTLLNLRRLIAQGSLGSYIVSALGSSVLRNQRRSMNSRFLLVLFFLISTTNAHKHMDAQVKVAAPNPQLLEPYASPVEHHSSPVVHKKAKPAKKAKQASIEMGMWATLQNWFQVHLWGVQGKLSAAPAWSLQPQLVPRDERTPAHLLKKAKAHNIDLSKYKKSVKPAIKIGAKDGAASLGSAGLVVAATAWILA